MIGMLEEWLRGIVAAAVILRLVRGLRPKGTVGRVAEFTGSLVLLAAMLQPLGAMEFTQISPAALERSVEKRAEQLQSQWDAELLAVIEAQTAAYISDKEPQLTVKVTAEETGKPAAVELTGPYSPEVSRWIEEELGISAERQVWHEGET